MLNSLTTLDNNLFLNDLKFGPGDGFLRWYLYNWRARPIAGGMGARPGEAELDPAASLDDASSGQARSGKGKAGAERSPMDNGTDARSWLKGSGLGVAMV